jgi:addiction module HigA family antidote
LVILKSVYSLTNLSHTFFLEPWFVSECSSGRLRRSALVDPSDFIRPNPWVLGPVHPGEVLRDEFLNPLGLSPNALAKALQLSPSRIGDIVLERRGVTADTAMRLARYFGGTAQFWLNLQSIYDLRTAIA